MALFRETKFLFAFAVETRAEFGNAWWISVAVLHPALYVTLAAAVFCPNYPGLREKLKHEWHPGDVGYDVQCADNIEDLKEMFWNCWLKCEKNCIMMCTTMPKDEHGNFPPADIKHLDDLLKASEVDVNFRFGEGPEQNEHS